MSNIVEDIKYSTEVAKVTLKSVPDRPGIAGLLFSTLGEHGFNIELIAQSSAGRRRTDISFVIAKTDLDSVLKLLAAIKMRFASRQIVVDEDIAMITIYGRKLPETPGIAGRLFSILADQKINIDIISASMTVISCVIKKDRVTQAIEVLRKGL